MAISQPGFDIAAQCQQLIQLLQSQLNNSKTTSGDDASASYMAGKHSSISPTTKAWILDSGASTHICCSKYLFMSLIWNSPLVVTLPNKTNFIAEFAGCIRLSKAISLHNVFYIPDFHFNLISVSSLTRDFSTFRIVFANNSCLIQDKCTLRTIGKGNLHNGLYFLEDLIASDDVVSLPLSSHSSLTVSKPAYDVWHRRFGHPSHIHLNALQDVLFFYSSACKKLLCSICPLAKQKHLSFDSHNSKSCYSF